MFYSNNGRKLDINNRKNLEKSLNIWKLNNEWFKETMKKIRKYFEVNENKTNMSQQVKAM